MFWPKKQGVNQGDVKNSTTNTSEDASSLNTPQNIYLHKWEQASISEHTQQLLSKNYIMAKNILDFRTLVSPTSSLLLPAGCRQLTHSKEGKEHLLAAVDEHPLGGGNRDIDSMHLHHKSSLLCNLNKIKYEKVKALDTIWHEH